MNLNSYLYIFNNLSYKYDMIIMIIRKMDLCIVCNLIVGELYQAITCDKCNFWCHIMCETGISLERYQDMLNGTEIIWVCIPCRNVINRQKYRDYGPFSLINNIHKDEVVLLEQTLTIEFNNNPTYTLKEDGNNHEGVSINYVCKYIS